MIVDLVVWRLIVIVIPSGHGHATKRAAQGCNKLCATAGIGEFSTLQWMKFSVISNNGK